MEAVIYRKENHVANVTINRPEAMNAISPDVFNGIKAAVDDIKQDESIKVMVITGDDRAFSAGADLKYIRNALDDLKTWYEYLHGINESHFALEEAPVPVIAKVRGYALAGGLELMLACDLAIAADDAVIGDQHANYGLMAGGGGTVRLTRKIGYQKAMELLLTGRWLSGKEAAEVGLVLKSVPNDELDAAVDELVANLVEKPRDCLKYTKRAVIRGMELPLRSAQDEELFALVEYFTSSADPKSGTDAFIGKKKPAFES